MKKKITSLLLSLCLVLSLLPAYSLASTGIKIVVDGRDLVLDQPPIIKSGRTLVPLRAIFEALQAVVDYNPTTKTITAKKGNTTVTLTIGSKSATINGTSVTLDVEAQIINGRTLVPVRFVSEALGEDISYDPTKKQVTVTTKLEAVSNLQLKDIADNGDGRDLQVSFNKVTDESKVGHYRIYVVKLERAYSFNLTMANQSSYYTTSYKTGSNQLINLTQTTRDTDGELLKVDQNYVAYVLSVNNNMNQNQNSLSAMSNVVRIDNAAVPKVTNVAAADVSDYGNGRDLQVSFTKAFDENDIIQYRVMVVRESQASSFNVAEANAVTSSNYTVVTKTGSNISTTLSSTSRDVRGNSIQNDISYRVYILSVANSTSKKINALSDSFATIKLENKKNVAGITNLRVADVSDYADGRDIEVSFTKSTDETNVDHYRVLVVRSSESSSFDLSKALNVASSNYTYVPKTGSNIKQILASNAKDTNGSSIQAGVNYRVFVLTMGEASRGYGNTLSTASAEIKLSSNPTDITVSSVRLTDVADFGDGRDLQVSFTIPSNEHRVSSYRVLIVRSTESLNLTTANNVSAGNYTVVGKTGSNISFTLSSSAKDVSGNLITTGVAYKAYVLSVGDQANSYLNSLSSASSAVTLNNNMLVTPVTNVRVTDIADFGDGRDMQVTFTKSADESKILEYRIIIAKSAQADGLNVATANTISSSNYTRVTKTGNNITQVLSSSTRDMNGEVIRSGVAYKALVLAVSSGGNNNNNALSTASTALTLSKNIIIPAVTNIVPSDIRNNANGSDLRVTFNKLADETKISGYRVIVVKDTQAASFNLSLANGLPASNYTNVSLTGSNLSVELSATARDSQGDLIAPGVAYRVFVLAVSKIGEADTNSLSSASAVITLSNPSVDPATNVIVEDVNNSGNGQDLQVSFTRATNESNIAYYAVMVVRASSASSFNLNTANSVPQTNYTIVAKSGSNINTVLSSTARDTSGQPIQNGVAYRVFVLSIADGNTATTNTLSAASNEITLMNKQLSWSGSFTESSMTPGTISSAVTVSVTGDSFVSTLAESVHYTVANLPTGLTVSVTRVSGTQLQITLTGTAEAHAASNSITNLSITFTNQAFTSGSVAGIASVSNNALAIAFVD